jgi:hypothetical protein
MQALSILESLKIILLAVEIVSFISGKKSGVVFIRHVAFISGDESYKQ